MKSHAFAEAQWRLLQEKVGEPVCGSDTASGEAQPIRLENKDLRRPSEPMGV